MSGIWLYSVTLSLELQARYLENVRSYLESHDLYVISDLSNITKVTAYLVYNSKSAWDHAVKEWQVHPYFNILIFSSERYC